MFSKVIYERLLYHNIKVAEVYSGGAIMKFVDHFSDKRIKLINNNHEQNAGHTATGYAKVSDEIGLCVVTSGPGVTNMITPLLDAKNDSTPLLLLSGQVPIKAIGTNAFQECPAVDITRHVTKWSYCFKPDDDPNYIIDKAIHIINDKKKGPVHLDIPKCILNSNVSSLNKKYIYFETKKEYKYEEVGKIINDSKKPILYIGKGCNDSSSLVEQFVNLSLIPFTTTIHAVGVISEDHPLSLKFLGMHGSPAANYAMQESDCIIALGSRFDDRTTGEIQKFAPEAKNIIHVNIEPSEICTVVKSNHNFEISCNEFLKNIIPFIKKNKNRHEWIGKIRNLKKQYSFKYKDYGSQLSTPLVISSLNRYLEYKKSKFIITTGVGNHQMMAAQFIKWKSPRSLITSGSLGVMGVGLPYAIGAQLAKPNTLVIDIDGDGSFNQTLGDLQTVARYNLPIKIFIMNDGQQSMVKAWEDLFFKGNNVATNLPNNPDYCKLANAYGIKSLKCDRKKDLDSVIKRAIDHNGPILVDFKCVSEICYPLVPPGAGLHEMLFDKTFPYMDNLQAPS